MYTRGGILLEKFEFLAEKFEILLEFFDGGRELFENWMSRGSLKSKIIGTIITIISISIGVYIISKRYG